MNYFKLFCRRISKDFKQKQLLHLKFLFFMHSSTILVLYPYLTIHMRELGINVQEAATMTAVTPIVAILMPPIAGVLADKIGNFRVMLAIFSTIGGLSALLLLLVPVGRISVTYPDRVIFGMGCSSGHPSTLSLNQDQFCTPHTVPNRTEMQLESCGIACNAVLTDNQRKLLLQTNTYGLQLHDLVQNSSRTYTYSLKHANTITSDEIALQTIVNHKTLKNDPNYLTAIRKLGKNLYYFPTHGLFNFSCDLSPNSDNTVNCALGVGAILDQFKTKQANQFNASVTPIESSIDDSFENLQVFGINFKSGHDSDCVNTFIKPGEYVSITLPLDDGVNNTRNVKRLDLGSCAAKCVLTAPRAQICQNDKRVIEVDMKMTFWSYLVIRVFVGIVSGTSFAMFEGAVIAILREHKADYGLQRIYATIGGMISSPVSGFLIDYASRGKEYTDYTPIFVFYAVLKVVSGFLMLFINLEFKKASHNVLSDIWSVLKKIELIALLFACLILGSVWGYIESFLFWLLQDLGGSKSLMGLTITVGGFVGIPLLVLSGPIIKRLGHANVIFIGFAFYAIRLMGYSVIYNPWLCLIFEAMESITFGLSFTAAVTYAAKLSTITTDTTIQGLLGGVYFAVGKGVGSFIGGYLIKLYGIRTTFQLFSIFTVIIGLLYLAFYHLYMKKRPSASTEITKKDDGDYCQKGNFAEKASQDFVDTDLNQKDNGQQRQLPAVYEDALTNPAFEDTEFDCDDEPNREKAKQQTDKTTISI